MISIIPLGTAGFIPSVTGRETCSVLVVDDQVAVLLDAGTGVRRLAEETVAREMSSVRELHVIFSHFHNDHVAGVTWLLRLWDGELSFHVPMPPLVDANGIDAIKRLCEGPYFSLRLEDWPQKPRLEPFTGTEVRAGDMRIEALKQQHAGGSVGYRVERFVYISDTDPGEEHERFAADAELLFVDTMHDASDYETASDGGRKKAQHGSSRTSGNLAHRSGVERLGLIHLDPLYDEDRLKRVLEESQSIFPSSFIPEEGSLYRSD